MNLRQMIYKQIVFIDHEIERLTQVKKLEIHEMADLERYSNTLANLTLSLVNMDSVNTVELEGGLNG